MSAGAYYQNRFARLGLVWLILVTLTLFGIASWWRLKSRGPAALHPDAVMRAVTPRGDLSAVEKTTIAIFRRNSPSVVHITTLVNTVTDDFGFDVQQVPEGTGSGFVWDKQGRIVTNFHVIRGADVAQVVLADHSTWKAHLVGASPKGDLAVLGIDAPEDRLQPIQLGTSHDLEVGQSVFAIGNPFGLDHTLTTGIVSALGRQLSGDSGQTIKDMIQIDAPINPGNSGGPLLDSSGRLIGVNSAIFSPSGAFAGIGFAIPVDKVNRVVTELIQHGKIIRPSLGIEPAPDQWVAELGLNGVLVLGVVPGGPAAKAGIRATHRTPDGQIELGDLILAIDGQTLESADDLLSAQESHKIGDTVTLLLLRDGQRREVKVTLAAPRQS
ncbi:MAG: trypsin-like peptidase domain-containing protein [Thermoguttaceae bacterium]|jgi:S1-C subfamily serine protease